MQMFQAFNFRVEIRLPESSHPLCEASFSECDGLEVTREVKSIREGGNNSTHLRLPGGVSYGQVTLKRGMTRGFDLWKWFDQSVSSPSLRASIDVVMLSAAREEVVRFTLSRALPVKLKAPALNARDGVIAIEELGVLFERMEVRYA